MRDFTFIEDINLKIFEILQFMKKREKKDVFEIINLGNGKKKFQL